MWGIIIILVGLFLLVCGRLKSENRVYRMLTARDIWIWEGKTHILRQVSGVLLIVIGIIQILGYG